MERDVDSRQDGFSHDNEASFEKAQRLSDLTQQLVKGINQLLDIVAPVFQEPAFLSEGLPKSERHWPRDYSETAKSQLAPEHLAAVGAVMLEWSRAEAVFEALIKHLANLPPVKEAGILQDIKFFSFKAKRDAWNKASKIVFIDDPESLKLSDFLHQRAECLSTRRNEIAHSNSSSTYHVDGLAIFPPRGKAGSDGQYKLFTVKNLFDLATDISNFRIAITAVTQHSVVKWIPNYSGIPEIFLSDTGLRTLRSYKKQKLVHKPPEVRLMCQAVVP